MLLTFHERRMADGRLKELTQRVIDTQEEERARLARELHDGISQNLVGVRYAMDLAGRKVRTDVDDAALTIDRGVEALNGAIKEIRRLSHDLRPRVLDDLGLTAALEALCYNFAERTGIETRKSTLRVSPTGCRPEASTALYRVAQEAFNNVERHSGATRLDGQALERGRPGPHDDLRQRHRLRRQQGQCVSGRPASACATCRSGWRISAACC